MVYIGNHLSVTSGYLAMGKEAQKLGANTFAFFTRNPRGGSAARIDPADASALMMFLEENHFGPIVAHGAYTMNVCAAKPDIREFSCRILAEDLERMEHLPGNFYNFHPGAHVGQGTDIAIPLIADAVNKALKPQHRTILLLETMAGKGSEVGRSFEELRGIIDRIELSEKVGVCLDTCHIWDGGYDLTDFDRVLDEFDRIIGLERLKALHLNDSMNQCGARKDRHEKLGAGQIGTGRLSAIVNHAALQGKPFILETPNDDAGYRKEISMVRSWNEYSDNSGEK